MPSITVNDGTYLYYEDSGIPFGSANYTTIFLIHGLVFHSRMLAVAIYSVLYANHGA